MDLFENLPLERLEHAGLAYDAGVAHGVVAGSLVILFLWMCCVQCTRPVLRRDRIREALRYL